MEVEGSTSIRKKDDCWNLLCSWVSSWGMSIFMVSPHVHKVGESMPLWRRTSIKWSYRVSGLEDHEYNKKTNKRGKNIYFEGRKSVRRNITWSCIHYYYDMCSRLVYVYVLFLVFKLALLSLLTPLCFKPIAGFVSDV